MALVIKFQNMEVRGSNAGNDNQHPTVHNILMNLRCNIMITSITYLRIIYCYCQKRTYLYMYRIYDEQSVSCVELELFCLERK